MAGTKLYTTNQNPKKNTGGAIGPAAPGQGIGSYLGGSMKPVNAPNLKGVMLGGGQRTGGPVQRGAQLGQFSGIPVNGKGTPTNIQVGTGGADGLRTGGLVRPGESAGLLGGTIESGRKFLTGGAIGPANPNERLGSFQGGRNLADMLKSNIRPVGPGGGSIGVPDRSNIGAYGGDFIGGNGAPPFPPGGAIGPVNPGDQLGEYTGGDSGKGGMFDGGSWGALNPPIPGGGAGEFIGGGGAGKGDPYSGQSPYDLISSLYDGQMQAQLDAMKPQFESMRNSSAVQNQTNLRAVLENASNRGDRGGMARQDELVSRLGGESAMNSINSQEAQTAAGIRSDAMAGRIKDILSQRQLDTENGRWDKEFDYRKQRDTIGDERYSDETQYARGRDAVGDERYADERDYGRGRDQVADDQWDRTYKLQQMQAQDQHSQMELDRAWQRVGTLGYVDEQASKVLGIPVGTKTQSARQWQAEFDYAKANRNSGGGGGGGGYSPYDPSKDKDNPPQKSSSGYGNPGSQNDNSNLGGAQQLKKLLEQGYIPPEALAGYLGARPTSSTPPPASSTPQPTAADYARGYMFINGRKVVL